MRIVHLSLEFSPYRWGGLGLSVSGLVQEQRILGHNVFVIFPFSQAQSNLSSKFSLVTSFDNQNAECSYYLYKHENENTYFIGLNRIKNTVSSSYSCDKNVKQSLKICAAAIKAIKSFISPKGIEVLHCHDWQFAFACFLAKQDVFFKNTLCCQSIHNAAYLGAVDVQSALNAGIESSLVQPNLLLNQNVFSCLRLGLIFADGIFTVSKEYRNETLLSNGAYGNEDILNLKMDNGKYFGIINGIDSSWNPATDILIHKNYDTNTFVSGKLQNKIWFQSKYGLLESPETPILCACCRITEQKGLQFLFEIMPTVIQYYQVVIVGDLTPGDEYGAKLLEKLSQLAVKYHRKIFFSPFSEYIEREALASSDVFYMCSLFEPGGLANLHALRYGLCILGSDTGGIHDSTIDLRTNKINGNGILLSRSEISQLLNSLLQISDIFNHQKQEWALIVKNAMSQDVSWGESANKYLEKYQLLINTRSGIDNTVIDLGVQLSPFFSFCGGVLKVSRRVLNLRRILAASYVIPGHTDYMYVIFKSSFLNLAARSFLVITAVNKGVLTSEKAIMSLIWYQIQDVFFTIYGKTYMNFIGSLETTVILFSFKIGDLVFVIIVFVVCEFSNRLILGPVGENPSVLTLRGFAIIFINIGQGMLSAGPVDSAICKLRNLGLISVTIANHIFQIMSLSMLFGLLASFGYQRIHAIVLVTQFLTFSSIYILALVYQKYQNVLTWKEKVERPLAEDSEENTHLISDQESGYYTLSTQKKQFTQHTPSPSYWSDQVFYSIMVDRFNPGHKCPPRATSGNMRQGGKLCGITANINYFIDLGVTTLLLSPVQTNAFQCVAGYECYHGYAVVDFLSVDPYLGTTHDLKELISACHKSGIYVILDFVINHMGPVFEYDDLNKTSFEMHGKKDIGSWNHNINPPVLSTQEHFSCAGVIQDWEDIKQIRLGDFPPNFRRLASENSNTQDIILAILKYWILEYDIDGFRLDAVKHVAPQFVKRISSEICDYSCSLGKFNFFLLGECSSADFNEIYSYLGSSGLGLHCVYNYPGYRKTLAALKGKANTRIFELNFHESVTKLKACSHQVLNFLDNHDVYRFLNQKDNEFIIFPALSYILFSIGVPMIYYATEQAFRQTYNTEFIPENGLNPADPQNRKPMFHVKNNTYETALMKSSYLFTGIQRLLSERKKHRVLSRGTQEVRWSDATGPGIFAFSRIYKETEAIIVLNTSSQSKVAAFLIPKTRISVGTELQDVFDEDYIIKCEPYGVTLKDSLSVTVEVPQANETNLGVRILMINMKQKKPLAGGL